MYIYIYIYLYIYLSISLSLYIYISIYLSISLSLSIYIYIYMARPPREAFRSGREAKCLRAFVERALFSPNGRCFRRRFVVSSSNGHRRQRRPGHTHGEATAAAWRAVLYRCRRSPFFPVSCEVSFFRPYYVRAGKVFTIHAHLRLRRLPTPPVAKDAL